MFKEFKQISYVAMPGKPVLGTTHLDGLTIRKREESSNQ